MNQHYAEKAEALQKFVRTLVPPFKQANTPGKPNVVAILDDFSVNSFSEFLNLYLVAPDSFQLDLEHIDVDFLFVESAWSGNAGKWKYMVTSSNGPKQPLIDLVESCKRREIPTVFWNKEDPPHFDDFCRTARLFDYIFTSDAAMIPNYEEIAPNSTIELLQFAASPLIHNPMRAHQQEVRDIAFAGQYFSHKFPERRQQMEDIFPAAMEYEFDIFSRALGGDDRYQFPQPYAERVVGSLPYTEMVKAYNDYKVFLNVNSVVNSETMCARRVFELSACKTAVFGMESRAIRSIYDRNAITLAANRNDVGPKLQKLVKDDQYRREMVQNAWRTTLARNTYGHRVDKILKTIGQAPVAKSLKVVIKSVGEFELSEEWCKGFISSQTFDIPQTVLWYGENDCGDETETKNTETVYLYVSPNYVYGPLYTMDLYLSLSQSGADFVAKSLVHSGREEETFANALPAYGWMSKPELDTNVMALNFEDGIFVPRPDLNVYYSDSFEISKSSS